MKYYVDESGKYIGAFGGSNCDQTGAKEVSYPPGDARQIWDGTRYLDLVIPIAEQITALENSVTPRNYREFVMGVQYSIDKINKVEADIAILRAKL